MKLSVVASVLALVYPSPASKLSVTSLSDLIYSAMPPVSEPFFRWTALQQASIRWLTTGIGTQKDGDSYRQGLARVRVGGKRSTVLRQQEEELAWTVTLLGDVNPAHGPQEIEFKAGVPMKPCFESDTDGCSFKASDAVSSSKFKATRVCDGDFYPKQAVYRIDAVGKREVFLAVLTDGGSGGTSSTGTLSLVHPGCEVQPL